MGNGPGFVISMEMDTGWGLGPVTETGEVLTYSRESRQVPVLDSLMETEGVGSVKRAMVAVTRRNHGE